jgi:amino acid transporter
VGIAGSRATLNTRDPIVGRRSIGELLFGRPLRTEEQEVERIGALRGIPVLGLDALASSAYGPEAALTILLPAAALGPYYVRPISAAILALLGLVFLSYRQTIGAYPDGGGSYTVASENLGRLPGLLAASALSVDYILNVAVGIAAGVGAVVSAVPALLPYTLPLCLAILALLTIVNLRGVREAGFLFMTPTYLFVACLGGTILLGTAKTLLAHGAPEAVVRPPGAEYAAGVGTVSLWLLIRAFASGCTAMTGVEAVSNGVPIFREPRVRTAERTLGAIVALLACFLAGIAFLAGVYHIGATPPGRTGYESVLSQLVSAVAGRGMFYSVAMGSLVTVLSLSANTSFADFPRICRLLARDGYLPAEFANLGRRLVYTEGIVVLSVLAALILIVFGGITDHLIPLFAVGAFLAFTMSQLGMVAHWRRHGGLHRRRVVLNAAGAIATAATLVVIVVSKFEEGAWITALVIPAFVALYLRIRRIQERADAEVEEEGPLVLGHSAPPIVLVPLKRLDRVAQKALGFAVTISKEVQAVHVRDHEPADGPDADPLSAHWEERVAQPARAAGLVPPTLVPLQSPYREFFGPLLDYVRRVAAANPGRYVAVLVPELVERRWYHFLLSSHRATFLKGLLLLRGGPQVVVINTPWYLRESAGGPASRPPA